MRGALPLLLAAFVAGCGYSSKTADSDKVPLSDAPAATADANAPAPAGALAGPVLETMDAPPYTYVLVKTTQGETWAAVPQAAVAKGANVRVYNPMLMTQFESKALKRTFDEIYFGTLTPDGADAANAGGPAMADGTNPHAGINAPPAEPVKVGKVEKAAGADAYTIAEAWAKKDALSGKVIAIRGVVVKYNAQVMGKNWVHLQDGSGDAAKNTNDITVVTMDETAKGQTITIRGTVKTSKDYGAGYKYAIIIEDAKIVK